MGFFKMVFFKMMCVTKILLLAFIKSNDEEDITGTSDEYCMNKYIDKYCERAICIIQITFHKGTHGS